MLCGRLNVILLLVHLAKARVRSSRNDWQNDGSSQSRIDAVVMLCVVHAQRKWTLRRNHDFAGGSVLLRLKSGPKIVLNFEVCFEICISCTNTIPLSIPHGTLKLAMNVMQVFCLSSDGIFHDENMDFTPLDVEIRDR